MRYLVKFSPVRSDEALAASIDSGQLVVNGNRIDLVETDHEAATMLSEWLDGPILVTEDEITFTLVIPVSANAPDYVNFPQPITMDGGGVINFPRDAQ